MSGSAACTVPDCERHFSVSKRVIANFGMDSVQAGVPGRGCGERAGAGFLFSRSRGSHVDGSHAFQLLPETRCKIL
jgi:hypothetical protein